MQGYLGVRVKPGGRLLGTPVKAGRRLLGLTSAAARSADVVTKGGGGSNFEAHPCPPGFVWWAGIGCVHSGEPSHGDRGRVNWEICFDLECTETMLGENGLQCCCNQPCLAGTNDGRTHYRVYDEGCSDGPCAPLP